ncbi:unnamed protein product [Oikopleura dioica]|uniref:Protein kinase domain-containing protein n=1 Tax=Oikopleura dioica TaxID=34765 RepID=E4Y043_OIKDI|nr:unnamed protein product [Oikopleura dioica]
MGESLKEGRYSGFNVSALQKLEGESLARDNASGKFVIVKSYFLTSFESWKKVQDEAQRLKLLEHQNIVRLIDFLDRQIPKWAFGSMCFIILEYCDGGSLKDWIFRRSIAERKTSFDEAKILGAQLVSALSFCHKKNLNYLNLAPSNVFIYADDITISKIFLIDKKCLHFKVSNIKNDCRSKLSKILPDSENFGDFEKVIEKCLAQKNDRPENMFILREEEIFCHFLVELENGERPKDVLSNEIIRKLENDVKISKEENKKISERNDLKLQTSVKDLEEKNMKIEMLEKKIAKLEQKIQLQEKNSEMITDDLVQSAEAILNTITSGNEAELTRQFIRDLKPDTFDRLEKIVDVVFSKAINEEHSTKICANLSKNCHINWDKDDRTAFVRKDDGTYETIIRRYARDRSLERRFFRFVGEIYMEGLVSVNIIKICCAQLVYSDSENELESLCNLISTIGKRMQTGPQVPARANQAQIMQIEQYKKNGEEVTELFRNWEQPATVMKGAAKKADEETLRPVVVPWAMVESQLLGSLEAHSFGKAEMEDFTQEFDIVKRLVPEGPDGRVHPNFIKVLVNAVMSFAVDSHTNQIIVRSDEADVRDTNFSDCELLMRKYINNEDDRIEALFVFADIFRKKHENNPKLIKEVFSELYELSIIEIPTFQRWIKLRKAEKLENFPVIFAATKTFYDALEEEVKLNNEKLKPPELL